MCQTQKIAIRFGANNCVKNCFQNNPNFFYCTSSRTTGWCCPDASRIECQDNPQNEVVCSNGAAFANLTKYAFCPRSLSACGTAGPVLYPLMTNNQTLLVQNTMTSVPMTVCYYELRINKTHFQDSHPNVPLQSVFFNVYIQSTANLTVYMYVGDDRKNITSTNMNVVQKQAYRYSLLQGGSVFIVAYPNPNITQNQNSTLSLVYNYSTDYYVNDGVNVKYLPSLIPPGFYHFIIIGFSIGLAIVIGVLSIICYQDYDPYTKFEKRRHEMAKAQRKQLKDELKRQAESKAKKSEDGDGNEEGNEDDGKESLNTRTKSKQSKVSKSPDASANLAKKAVKNNYINQDDQGPLSSNDEGQSRIGIEEIEMRSMQSNTRSGRQEAQSVRAYGVSPRMGAEAVSNQIGYKYNYQGSNRSQMEDKSPEFQRNVSGERREKSPQMVQQRNQANRGPELISFGVQPQQQQPVYFVPRKQGPSSTNSKEDKKFHVLQRPQKRTAKQAQKLSPRQDESNPFDDQD